MTTLEIAPFTLTIPDWFLLMVIVLLALSAVLEAVSIVQRMELLKAQRDYNALLTKRNADMRRLDDAIERIMPA